ncbi:hypothetical protein QSU92_14210 [Microbacterium sp. ET2]|uniref:hypothetical protein n=1 Tax=Microbacterium albipurpureum TaxID=3050384 RepID=UPI00259D2A3D|nr:hypothetical protein [Microbacterium sp. ET2 (Ac-2212)]WJL95089.1 hypothetical protein QSU92_14210 [Microbacterium sp. ET2 (Ac-2212)]
MSGGFRRRAASSPLVQRNVRRWADLRAARRAGTSVVGKARVRLLIAPVNSAGQGYAWARAAERLPGVAATDFMYRNPQDVFAYPADHSVPTVFFRTNRRWQHAQRRAVERRFTHVIIESGRQVLGTKGDTLEQVRLLRARGIDVALLWHGSDIRQPSRHALEEPDSPFRDGGYPETELLEDIVLRNQRLMREAAAPVFVSTPDLLAEVEHATWLPVVVDAELWRAAAPQAPLQRRRPVVVHAPSNAGLKGSALIQQTMRSLDTQGVIEYREVRGVAAAEMPAIYGGADIVLDQFALGIYGVAACEAMAAGRLVISHVAERTRTIVQERTGRRLPILEASARTLEATIRRLSADPTAARVQAAEGPAFVHAVHDGRRSAEALRGFLACYDAPGAASTAVGE